MIDSRTISPSSASFFEEKYGENTDPWRFSTDAYELSRYDAIVDAIAHRRYSSAFEPGCSIGVLTEKLATLCDHVEAIDFSSLAAARAKMRCSKLSNVNVRCASIKDGATRKQIDLLVLSEIGYYFGRQDWQVISSSVVASLAQGGIVLAAHWLGSSQDHMISGDEVHEILHSNHQLRLEHSERNDLFRLDRLVRQ